MIEGSLKSNFRRYGQMEKQRWGEPEKRKEEERRSEKRKSQKKEDVGAGKGRKVVKRRVFVPIICGSGGSKSRLSKAAGAEPSGGMRDENCTPLWRGPHLEVNKLEAPHVRSTFGS